MIPIQPKHFSFQYSREILTIAIISYSAFFLIPNEGSVIPVSIAFTAVLLIKLSTNYWIGIYKSTNKPLQRALNQFECYLVLLGLLFLLYPLVSSPADPENIVAVLILVSPIIAVQINLIMISVMSNRENRTHTKYTLVAGVGGLAENIEKHLYTQSKSGTQLKGFINCNKEVCAVGQEKVVGDLKHINEYLSQNTVDEIVIALPIKVSKKVKKILRAADYHGVRVKYIPDYRSLLGENYKMIRYGEIDAINVRQLPLDETNAFLLKNTFDKLFAFFALLALLPLFVVLGILIKLDSPGPVFYCPVRIGKGGRAFKLFKLRSMRVNDVSSGGTLSTQQNDPRVTKLGRILRKYSLDELPQFINVLLGDMSVVGPRPHRSFLNQQLQASVDKYMIRHYFKPGITGWAQVNGWRGPTETDEQRRQRTMHDLWYMEKWSFLLDLKIIFKTLYSRKVHLNAF